MKTRALDTVRLDWNAVAALSRGEALTEAAAGHGPTARPEANPAEADLVSAPTVTCPASPEPTTGPDPLASLLDTPLAALREPLAVDSAIVGRLFLVRDEDQAREVRAAVPREEWKTRLAAIHRVKVEFQGQLHATKADPVAARRLLHELLDRWWTMQGAGWSPEEAVALKDRVVGFWSTWPDHAQTWLTQWQATHPCARLT